MKMRIGMSVSCAVLGVMLGSAAWGADAWCPGWDYRQKITVDQALVSGAGVHTNFQVLITESNVTAALWQYAQTNGADIIFTAADGVTRLAHDLEQFDVANTRLCAWVKIPELAGEANTSFYIYYGYPLATNAQNGAAVWSDYSAVWHLRENSGTRYDATTNGANLATNGVLTHTASGKINGACNFDGTSGYLSASKQVINGDSTVSAWVKMPASLSKYHAIFDTGYDPATLIRQGGSGGQALEVFVRNGNAIITDTSFFTGTENAWLYVTLVLSNGTAYLYRNGQYRTSAAYTGTPLNTWLNLGNWSGGGHYWTGDMDETRACKLTRSSDWIATEYANQNAPASFASALAEERAPASDAPWHAGWRYRQRLFVDGSQVSGSLSNFPALVTERNVRSNLWLNAKSDGSDILFTAGDGVTKLAHELEKFDTAGKQLCAWVKLPLVSAASNTTFFVYYGRPSAANQETPAGVWTGYRAVWHLKEILGTRYDSTSNDADVAPYGGVSHTVSGRVDGACSFDGTTGYLSANKQVINGNATVSAWVKMPAALSTGRAIFDTGYNAGTLIREFGSASGEQLEVWVHEGSAANIRDATYFQGTENSWVYLTLVMSNNTVYLYRNGQFRMSGSYSGTPLNTFVNIGVWPGGPHYWNSTIDETRVAVDVLSADWIATEYRNQGTPSAFTFASAEEAQKSSGAVILIR